MPLDRKAAIERLKMFDISALFTQELGWDWYTAETRITANKADYTLKSEGIEDNSAHKVIRTKQGHKIEYHEMNTASSKPIIDEIDRVLARHYGFTDEELDFIINYDIKYRMGLANLNGDEDDAE